MIDGHVHLDKGPLTIDYFLEFVKCAQEKGVNHLQVLNHTHRFKQFEKVYKPFKIGGKQSDWLDNDLKDDINDYLNLIEKTKKLDLPIKVSYGLEVCYNKQNEELLKEILSNYHFDFLIGSVHFIFNTAYDAKWSVEDLWKKYDTDDIYRNYYEEVVSCIESGLFTQIGHPDTIKMFNYYPSYDLMTTYLKIAQLAKEKMVKLENNVGCHYRYGHQDIGLNRKALEVFEKAGCNIITASDAHKPNDVGNCIEMVVE